MGRAQAQATAQRQQAITNQDSFQLVKCLIRVSVYHVCWMRGLFPEGSFTGHDLAQLDQLHVKMLEPNEEDDEATTLKNWVEQGVMDAVSKGYLKNMYFGIAQDAAATNLLEEYIYSFRYGEDGVEFEMAATAHGKKKDKYNSKNKDRQRPGVDDVRYQVVRLMRMLVQLCQTLDKVPQQRYLFIKLTYHDHAPADYEPPFFHGVAEEGIGHFHRRPFSMDVGCMDTHHHMVSVRVKSVLDSCDDEEGVAGDDAMMELQASQQVCPAAGGSAPSGGDEDMGEAGGDTTGRSQQEAGDVTALVAAAADMSPDANRHRTEEVLALLTATEDQAALLMETEGSLPLQDGPGMAAGQQAGGPADSQDVTRMTDDHMEEARGTSAGMSGGCSGQAAYESVRSFCLQRPSVAYVDLMATFYELSEEQLAKVLDGLVREGLIQTGRQKDTYKVLQPSRAAAPAPQPPTASEGIMAERGAGSGGSVAAAAGPMNMNGNAADLAEDQLLNNQMSGLSVGAAAAGRKARGAAGLDASVYGAAMRAGSLMTGQPGAPAGAPTAADPQANQAAAGDESSVQLQADQQGGLWFDASQHSFQGPHAAVGGGSNAAAGTAAAGAAAGNSRLRKASYVNSPIYQHPGKRGPGSKLHQQQQQEEAGVEAEPEQEQQQAPAAAAAAAPDAAMAPPRKKLTVRKPKKPAATTTAAAGTPARGRLAAMKG